MTAKELLPFKVFDGRGVQTICSLGIEMEGEKEVYIKTLEKTNYEVLYPNALDDNSIIIRPIYAKDVNGREIYEYHKLFLRVVDNEDKLVIAELTVRWDDQKSGFVLWRPSGSKPILREDNTFDLSESEVEGFDFDLLNELTTLSLIKG